MSHKHDKATSENLLVVQVPYGSRAWGHSNKLLNEDKEYQHLFSDAVIYGEYDSSQADSSVYVWPNLSSDKPITQEEGERNKEVLTESPIVYIIYFKQTDTMKSKDWLRNAVGDHNPDKTKLYKRDYVVYIGETNDIVRRTNQHLTKNANFIEDLTSDSFDEVVRELDDRTKADRVIQKAIQDNIPVKQYVIWDQFFTKSMTLDMEHKFIDYTWTLDNVYTLNRRGNPQKNYYKSEQKDVVCSRIWSNLSLNNPVLFPPEQDIWNSELYKVSPFHALGKEQTNTVNTICNSVVNLLNNKPICGEQLSSTTSDSKLIIVSGASGTGKSIVLSTLFVKLSAALSDKKRDPNNYGIKPTNRVCLVVNQDQQKNVYSNLAKKIGLTRTSNGKDACVYRATPFLNAVSGDNPKRSEPDVVLVDEAHLLRTSPHRSYPGTFHGNQLYDILLHAKIVIAVFDPEQVMRSSQKWSEEELSVLVPNTEDENDSSMTYTGPIELHNNGNSIVGRDTFNTYRITLTEQFRIDAGKNIIAWIDRLCNPEIAGAIQPIPNDDKDRGPSTNSPFDLRVFTSPNTMALEIEKQRSEIEESLQQTTKGSAHLSAPLCRLLATYDWSYDTSKQDGAVTLYKVHDNQGNPTWMMPDEAKDQSQVEEIFFKKWNYTSSKVKDKRAWTSNELAEDEVGSYFSVQGFDLNYAGVIIGPSIIFRDGKIQVDHSWSKDSDLNKDSSDKLILQQLKVLLRRSIHGLYLFAVDPALQNELVKAARTSGKLVDDPHHI